MLVLLCVCETYSLNNPNEISTKPRCDETGGTICYGHWVLHLVVSHTRQGVRFVTGIGFCILYYQCVFVHRNMIGLRGLGLNPNLQPYIFLLEAPRVVI